MERASLHPHEHHNKAVSPRARRAPLWLTAPLALALAAFGPSAFGAPVFPRYQSGHPSATGPNRQLAEKDVQVGQFYLKIGKYDASISRFQSAVSRDPRWATPHELLGEVFEKKNEPKKALAEYREYLKLAPHAKDAKKVKQRVEKLARDVGPPAEGSR
ncbi:MAG TPA: hypothetical protein VNJ52_06800 [Patescibacteria group bacterium]|nr:hypothetical protein [Patescibacteria group bacterium]